MSMTSSNSRHHQRLAARAHITPLLLLVTACSGSPVSLGSGLDSQESALTGNTVEPSGTEGEPTPLWPVRETCADNPLLVGCPTADGTGDEPTPIIPMGETCADNPLLVGCPTADGTEDEPTPIIPMGETCADNPLLVGCPTADGTEDCTDNPLLPGCPTADDSD
jgi:hypothetical protein